jgi:DNA-directed RNA polymerase subunit N (RpoN/RPB10)
MDRNFEINNIVNNSPIICFFCGKLINDKYDRYFLFAEELRNNTIYTFDERAKHMNDFFNLNKKNKIIKTFIDKYNLKNNKNKVKDEDENNSDSDSDDDDDDRLVRYCCRGMLISHINSDKEIQ